MKKIISALLAVTMLLGAWLLTGCNGEGAGSQGAGAGSNSESSSDQISGGIGFIKNITMITSIDQEKSMYNSVSSTQPNIGCYLLQNDKNDFYFALISDTAPKLVKVNTDFQVKSVNGMNSGDGSSYGLLNFVSTDGRLFQSYVTNKDQDGDIYDDDNIYDPMQLETKQIEIDGEVESVLGNYCLTKNGDLYLIEYKKEPKKLASDVKKIVLIEDSLYDFPVYVLSNSGEVYLTHSERSTGLENDEVLKLASSRKVKDIIRNDDECLFIDENDNMVKIDFGMYEMESLYGYEKRGDEPKDLFMKDSGYYEEIGKLLKSYCISDETSRIYNMFFDGNRHDKYLIKYTDTDDEDKWEMTGKNHIHSLENMEELLDFDADYSKILSCEHGDGLLFFKDEKRESGTLLIDGYDKPIENVKWAAFDDMNCYFSAFHNMYYYADGSVAYIEKDKNTDELKEVVLDSQLYGYGGNECFQYDGDKIKFYGDVATRSYKNEKTDEPEFICDLEIPQ